MTSLLTSSRPINISHRLFLCRYSNSRAPLPFPAPPPERPGELARSLNHVYLHLPLGIQVQLLRSSTKRQILLAPGHVHAFTRGFQSHPLYRLSRPVPSLSRPFFNAKMRRLYVYVANESKKSASGRCINSLPISCPILISLSRISKILLHKR